MPIKKFPAKIAAPIDDHDEENDEQFSGQKHSQQDARNKLTSADVSSKSTSNDDNSANLQRLLEKEFSKG